MLENGAECGELAAVEGIIDVISEQEGSQCFSALGCLVEEPVLCHCQVADEWVDCGPVQL